MLMKFDRYFYLPFSGVFCAKVQPARIHAMVGWLVGWLDIPPIYQAHHSSVVWNVKSMQISNDE